MVPAHQCYFSVVKSEAIRRLSKAVLKPFGTFGHSFLTLNTRADNLPTYLYTLVISSLKLLQALAQQSMYVVVGPFDYVSYSSSFLAWPHVFPGNIPFLASAIVWIFGNNVRKLTDEEPPMRKVHYANDLIFVTRTNAGSKTSELVWRAFLKVVRFYKFRPETTVGIVLLDLVFVSQWCQVSYCIDRIIKSASVLKRARNSIFSSTFRF